MLNILVGNDDLISVSDENKKETLLKILTDAVEQTTNQIMITNKEGAIKYVNPAFEKKSGYAQAELLGQKPSLFKSGKQSKLFYEELWSTLSKGETFQAEFINKNKNGSFFHVEEVLSSIKNDQGLIVNYVSIGKEVLENKLTQERLQQAIHQLQQANKELRETQAQLIQSAKLASLGEVATGIAHELNQPLSIIQVYCENLINSWETERIQDPRPSLEAVLGQVERASKITNHLRTFGQDSQLQEFRVETVDRIIEDSFILVNEQIKLQGVIVFKEYSKDLPALYCNPSQLEQVLTNLFTNAKDAMDYVSQKELWIRTYQKDGYVVIEVRDTGEGIKPEDLENIFDPFFTTKEVGKGTGLGLSISHGIIKSHQGKIEVESQRGQGATFRICLPPYRPNVDLQL
ncbi:ATP-binding protein [Deltaproteobacteria bacterium TL4]